MIGEVIAESDARVIVASITLLGSILGYAGFRANRTNRKEHAINTGKLDDILTNQDGIRREVHFIRADVTDIHGAITELRRSDSEVSDRVTHLERHGGAS